MWEGRRPVFLLLLKQFEKQSLRVLPLQASLLQIISALPFSTASRTQHNLEPIQSCPCKTTQVFLKGISDGYWFILILQSSILPCRLFLPRFRRKFSSPVLYLHGCSFSFALSSSSTNAFTVLFFSTLVSSHATFPSRQQSRNLLAQQTRWKILEKFQISGHRAASSLGGETHQRSLKFSQEIPVCRQVPETAALVRPLSS